MVKVISTSALLYRSYRNHVNAMRMSCKYDIPTYSHGLFHVAHVCASVIRGCFALVFQWIAAGGCALYFASKQCRSQVSIEQASAYAAKWRSMHESKIVFFSKRSVALHTLWSASVVTCQSTLIQTQFFLAEYKTDRSSACSMCICHCSSTQLTL